MGKYFNINKSTITEPGLIASYDARIDHLSFTDGHFPSNPILPAYALSILATECLTEYFSDHPSSNLPVLEMYKIYSSKFIAPARPDKNIQIKLTDRNNHKLELKIYQEGQHCTTLIYQLKKSN